MDFPNETLYTIVYLTNTYDDLQSNRFLSMITDLSNLQNMYCICCEKIDTKTIRKIIFDLSNLQNTFDV